MNKILTSRQVEVLQYISEGLSTYDISNLLKISEYTITTHRRNIIELLSAKNIIHAVTIAIKKNLIIIK